MPDDDEPTGRFDPFRDDASSAAGDSTQRFPAPGPRPDGWVLGNRYRVTGRIGAGGMADVFRAHDELLNRDVAVKVFRSTTGADTAAGAERQRAELHALARLNHPNLITLYDGSVAGPDDAESRAYLVMELVEGPNLGHRIDSGPLPTEAEVRVIGTQIADALAYVHEQGMVHRDVKPANILLGAGNGAEQVRARLSDFGIVRLVGAERLTQADSTLGTASYLAPEQARGSGVGPAADIYALGLTLIEALTGVRSFDAPTPLEAVVARLDRDPEVPQHLPQPWPGLLAGMTARDPAMRPTARQVAGTLRGTGALGTTQYVPAAGLATGATTVIPPAVGMASGGMPPVRPVAEPLPLAEPEPKRRNTGLIVGLILAAALIVIGVLILLATSGGDDNSPATTPTPSTTAPSTPSPTPSSPSSEPESSPPTTEEDTPTETQTETVTTEAPTTQEETTPPSTPPTTEQTTPPTSTASTSAGNNNGNGNGGGNGNGRGNGGGNG